MITIDDKYELRNLEEQVKWNKDMISKVITREITLASFGIREIQHVAKAEDIPSPAEYKAQRPDWEYGDAYSVGQEAPYYFWVLTRADNAHTEDYWFDLGLFPAPGPKGEKGDKGDKGDTGATGPVGPMGRTGATGPQGIQGERGLTGLTGATGPQGPQGDPGEPFTLLGTIANVGQLPDPSAVIRSAAYRVGPDANGNYALYVIEGEDTLLWTNYGDIKVGPQGPKGDAGLSPLVWEGGVFYTRDNIAIGATVNMGPTSSFNRTPVAGDTYNVLLTQRDENDAEIASYFCQLKITQVVGGAFVSEITNFTKTTGTDGTNGLPALTYGSTINVDTIPQIGHDFSWAPMFSSNFNRTPIAGDVLIALVNHQSVDDSYMCSVQVTEYTFPTLKGTYKNVTKATGKVGDTVNLGENQHLTIHDSVGITSPADYVKFANHKLTLDTSGNTNIAIGEATEDTYVYNTLGENITVDGAAVGAVADVTNWLPINAYYEITGVPTSSISGTLPDNISWSYLTGYPEQLRILFNKEFYQFADNQHKTGELIFSHVGYEDAQLIIKTIRIIIANRGWTLTTNKPATKVAAGYNYLTSDSGGSNNIGAIFYSLPSTYNMDVDNLINVICDVTYFNVTGYVTYNGVTEPVVAVDAYDPTSHTINVYTPTHTVDSGGISCYTAQFLPDFISIQ